MLMGGVMRVVVNGKPVECEEGTSLRDLIAQLGFEPGAVVAERNRELVPGDDFAQTRLVEGDALELLQFVGGG
jgi:sulfur carrier protein